MHARQHLSQRPLGFNFSLLKHHQMVSKTGHLCHRVTDIKNRQRKLIAQTLQIGQDFRFALLIQRRHRLIHQQQPWLN